MSILRSSVGGVLLAVACTAYAAPAAAQCQITGRTVVCPDTSITLCAAPASGYFWTDVNGNVLSQDQCLVVTLPGDYSLYEQMNGAWMGPCNWSVAAAPPESCATAPPPPPPPPPSAPTLDTLACPRPAGWWTHVFRHDGLRQEQFDNSTLASLAQCVDGRTSLFAWPNSFTGLKATLRPIERRMDLRELTLRQYAAILANMCADQAGLTRRNGQRFGLGADAKFTWDGVTTTVGAWVETTDYELFSLEGASLGDKGVRSEYLRIHAQAWAIGHGRGMASSCTSDNMDNEVEDASASAALGSEALVDAGVAPAPVAMPNPFHSSMRLSFAVTDPSGSDVDVSVFDVAGRRMATIARGHMDPGTHLVQWDGRGLDGSRARAGMYFVRGRIGTSEVATSVMKIE